MPTALCTPHHATLHHVSQVLKLAFQRFIPLFASYERFFFASLLCASHFSLDISFLAVYILPETACQALFQGSLMYTKQISAKHRVVTPKGAANLRIHLVGPHPILQHFLGQMTLPRIIRSCLGTPREGILDHAQTISILIQNIILSPAPLYRIAEWAEPIDPAALGLSEVEKKSINDDRIARSLDALASTRARSLFFRLALHIIKEFELDTKRIHHDTTTVTFHGQYKGSYKEPRITHGINKDHRPDLKQLVFGLNVTADGAVPISHEIYSGNRTDDTVHRSNVDRLRQILGREDFIYVADSKLCTRKNLQHVTLYGGQFVTVLPRTRAEDKGFRKLLRQGGPVRWRRTLVLTNKRRKSDPPNVYYTTAQGPDQTSEGYRIIWYRSSQKMQLDAQTRETALQKAKAELFDLNARLNRRQLRTRAAISKKVKSILAKHNCQGFLKVTIASQVQVRIKRLRRGRPAEGDPVQEIRRKIFHLRVQRDKDALRAESRTDGVFAQVTNLQPRHASKKQVLLIYKYQPYIEKRHALLKSELEVAPIYLKKPHRAVALVDATFLAITLDALIERTVRQAMQGVGIDTLPILPEGRPTKTPTTARLLEVFSDVSWYEFQRGGETVTFPIALSPLQKQLLRLLDMDPSAYA
jgi:transposase